MALNLGRDPLGFARTMDVLNRKVAASVTGADAPATRLAGLALERAIKLKLSQPGTGREYRRGNKVHVASAPGEPPAVDRGFLRNSVGQDVVGGVLRVGTGADYAPDLEFGTPSIAARPFMRPALEEVKDQLTDVVIAELRKVDPRGD